MNLESLRRKRARRLGVKASAHTGQRRIFFVLDRATRKFHGDIGLWMQYADYAKKQKAHKKVSQILTSLLRFHPTKPELWIYAANYAIEAQSDMTEARSYLQRGLRFCKRSKELWLEYAKLEMIYVAKIAARRRILGLDGDRQVIEQASDIDDPDADLIALPAITVEDINPNLQTHDPVDRNALQNLSATPALSGAIPIAIFDAAMEQFEDESLGERFFDMIAGFQGLPCLNRILQHVADSLIAMRPNGPAALSCFVRQPTLSIETKSSEFPRALDCALDRLKSSIDTISVVSGTKTRSHSLLGFVRRIVDWLVLYLEIDNMDPDIHMVLSIMAKRMLNRYRIAVQEGGGDEVKEVAWITQTSKVKTLENVIPSVVLSCLQVWPLNPALLALRDSMQISLLQSQ